MQATPFQIDISDRDLDDLRGRLKSTRWADDFGNTDWRYGVERDWLQEMAAYWRDQYDWRETQARMNRYSHYRVDIDGIPIHFMHVRGKAENAMPLVLTHGWPWTFWDFQELIDPLTDPLAYGGQAEDAFDLVVPSLPGFGFSTPLRTTDVDVARIAQLWEKLMVEVLGYPRYAAAGGDWGAAVTAQLGHAHDEHLIGVYMTMLAVPGLSLANIEPEQYAEDERWMPARNAEALPLIISHITVHSHDPQTLAYALVDSPVGTAAWLWERRRAWSDCNGDLLAAYDRTFLCDLASIYWLTGTIGSSLRIYYEHFKNNPMGSEGSLSHARKPSIAVPTGYGVFPKDVMLLPRALVAEHVNLQHWTVMPEGGHFGASEKPKLVLEDLRTFFRGLRRAQ